MLLERTKLLSAGATVTTVQPPLEAAGGAGPWWSCPAGRGSHTLNAVWVCLRVALTSLASRGGDDGRRYAHFTGVPAHVLVGSCSDAPAIKLPSSGLRARVRDHTGAAPVRVRALGARRLGLLIGEMLRGMPRLPAAIEPEVGMAIEPSVPGDMERLPGPTAALPGLETAMVCMRIGFRAEPRSRSSGGSTECCCRGRVRLHGVPQPLPGAWGVLSDCDTTDSPCARGGGAADAGGWAGRAWATTWTAAAGTIFAFATAAAGPSAAGPEALTALSAWIGVVVPQLPQEAGTAATSEGPGTEAGAM